MEQNNKRPRRRAESIIIMAVMISLLVVVIILTVEIFFNINVLKNDPCKACEELYKMSCVSLG
jgi:predicted TIM-barrel enzyme